jgi:hypothetical protein
MQKVSNRHKGLSTELVILEALVNAQNRNGDQSIIPTNVIRSIKDYVGASEAVLVLFDGENPDWANKRLLAPELTWKSERAFLTRNSSLCARSSDILMDYDGETDSAST